MRGCTSSPACSRIRSSIGRRGHGGARSTVDAVDRHRGGTRRGECAAGDELLGERHHVGVVRERLVALEHRELGVVPRRQALVAEHTADLEHALDPADEQALQVQLERDAQHERHVERVVVRLERPRRRTAGLHVQHRRLDLDEAALGEQTAQRGDAPRSGSRRRGGRRRWRSGRRSADESACRCRRGRATSRASGRSAFGEQLEGAHLHRELALASLHHRAGRADPVAEVEVVERAVRSSPSSARDTKSWIAPVPSRKRRERELALAAQQQDAPGDAHLVVGLCARVERVPLLVQLPPRCACARSAPDRGHRPPSGCPRPSRCAGRAPRLRLIGCARR